MAKPKNTDHTKYWLGCGRNETFLHFLAGGGRVVGGRAEMDGNSFFN